MLVFFIIYLQLQLMLYKLGDRSLPQFSPLASYHLAAPIIAALPKKEDSGYATGLKASDA
jgi:hypothetical protein